MSNYLRQATEKQEETIALTKRLVECESPSGDAAAIKRLNDLLVEETRGLATAKRLGGNLRLEFRSRYKAAAGAASDRRQILVLGHSDTVWESGTLKSMPFRRERGRLWGPGVLDMKGGVAFFISAMRILRDADCPREWRVVLLMACDEETGSRSSREFTESEARVSEHVLVLEPGTGLSGKLKTARKGVGDYHLRILGRASHAGVDFEAGASAIVEAARQVEKLAALTNLGQGTTVNPGVIQGGSRTNVIAAEAQIDIDIRVPKLRHAELLDRKLKNLRPVDKRCRLEMSGGLNRPPMERTAAIGKLFARARTIGKEMGIEIEESATGGGSDGNFTAALGVPTLDGLGAVGEGAHAANESILIDRIADRVALLAGLLN